MPPDSEVDKAQAITCYVKNNPTLKLIRSRQSHKYDSNMKWAHVKRTELLFDEHLRLESIVEANQPSERNGHPVALRTSPLEKSPNMKYLSMQHGQLCFISPTWWKPSLLSEGSGWIVKGRCATCLLPHSCQLCPSSTFHSAHPAGHEADFSRLPIKAY
ncbi:hypothetical protein PoB_002663300 [Plakobranchus ocellatus]|uniref:Uncharacterized protein n=1 Tax=Plakobranchus ocellatus TaxID=259542 RepID=A0AAV3ZZ14_9GAST|nr:hypothetical protein PoB_002663300 [Plakobranchus ocellatus]